MPQVAHTSGRKAKRAHTFTDKCRTPRLTACDMHAFVFISINAHGLYFACFILMIQATRPTKGHFYAFQMCVFSLQILICYYNVFDVVFDFVKYLSRLFVEYQYRFSLYLSKKNRPLRVLLYNGYQHVIKCFRN